MRDECFHFVLVCQTTCTELWVTSSYILVPMKGFAIQFRLLGEPLIENLFSMLMTRARLLKFKFAKQIYVETLGRKMRTWKRLPFSLWSGSNDLDSVTNLGAFWCIRLFSSSAQRCLDNTLVRSFQRFQDTFWSSILRYSNIMFF